MSQSLSQFDVSSVNGAQQCDCWRHHSSSLVCVRSAASDPEDCLIFNYEFTTQVEKHLVTGTVWDVQFTDQDFHIDLNQELYEECLERTRGVEERKTWKRTWRGTTSSCQNNLFWRNPKLKLPNRFYWKHGLIKAQCQQSGRETHKNSR